MRSEIAEQVLEELRALRRGQEALQLGQKSLVAEFAAVKFTAPECETAPGLAMDLTGHLQVQIASQTKRIDRFEDRLNRIERFFDPVEA